mmetsp:Transcript_65599/g.182421  ORF Transcript_65599/g.182421 Transcript_65599/m.182421 type:complete len:275 (-) Transcript_65599:1423-2247(-)
MMGDWTEETKVRGVAIGACDPTTDPLGGGEVFTQRRPSSAVRPMPHPRLLAGAAINMWVAGACVGAVGAATAIRGPPAATVVALFPEACTIDMGCGTELLCEEPTSNVEREEVVRPPLPLPTSGVESFPELVSMRPFREGVGDTSFQERRMRNELHISRNSPRNCFNSPRSARNCGSATTTDTDDSSGCSPPSSGRTASLGSVTKLPFSMSLNCVLAFICAGSFSLWRLNPRSSCELAVKISSVNSPSAHTMVLSGLECGVPSASAWLTAGTTG